MLLDDEIAKDINRLLAQPIQVFYFAMEGEGNQVVQYIQISDDKLDIPTFGVCKLGVNTNLLKMAPTPALQELKETMLGVSYSSGHEPCLIVAYDGEGGFAKASFDGIKADTLAIARIAYYPLKFSSFMKFV